MKTEKITSIHNSRIKHLKKLLSSKSYRWQEKEYISEGLRVFDDAKRLKEVFVCEGTNPPKLEIEKINVVTKEVFKEISSTENSQGIVAVSELLISDPSSINKDKRYVLLDKLQDPGNMGTIIRTVCAFGLDGLIIVQGCVDPFSPKVVRSAVSSIEKIEIIDLQEIDMLKNYNVIAADMNGEDVSDFKWPKGFILAIGNEGQGISEDLASISKLKVSIPITGKIESLNAAVAAGILLYNAVKE